MHAYAYISFTVVCSDVLSLDDLCAKNKMIIDSVESLLFELQLAKKVIIEKAQVCCLFHPLHLPFCTFFVQVQGCPCTWNDGCTCLHTHHSTKFKLSKELDGLELDDKLRDQLAKQHEHSTLGSALRRHWLLMKDVSMVLFQFSFHGQIMDMNDSDHKHKFLLDVVVYLVTRVAWLCR